MFIITDKLYNYNPKARMQGSENVELQLQLMQKQRNIADLEAKIKKTQFKHNRNLQEHKITHDRIQQLLKEQKQKYDKVSKNVRQKQEQNQLLLAKVSQLRQEKDKQVGELRLLYNGLKEEVRTYERVLPTLTFLNEFGLQIQGIPTYQHIFLELKNKIVQLEETQLRYKQFQDKSQEAEKTLRQNQQASNQKRQQAQRRLKDVLGRISDSEQQIDELSSTIEQQTEMIDSLRYELDVKAEKAESLESTIRQTDLKLQELDRAYSYELQAKEEQIRSLTQEEFDRYEDDIRSLEHRLEIKDSMYVQQVQILEEQVYFFKNLIGEEKEHFQQNYLVIKGEIQKMQAEVDQERFDHDQLKKRFNQLEKELSSVSKEKQLLQTHKTTLEKSISSIREQEKVTPTMSDSHVSQMENLQQSYSQLLSSFEHVTDRMGRYEEENKNLQDEVAHLRNELYTKNTAKPHLLELPTNFMQIEEVAPRKSTESEHQIELDLLHLQLQNKKSESPRLSQRQSVKESNIEQLTTLKKERDTLKAQLLKQKQKSIEVSSSLSQKEQQLLTLNKNHMLLKSKTDSLHQELTLTSEELKRQKQLVKALRDELKSSKDTANHQVQKYIKEKKQINSQFEIYKGQRDKLKIQYVGRQKSLMQEITLLRKSTQAEEHNKRQILLLQKEVSQLESHKKDMKELIADQVKEIQHLTSRIQILADECKNRERQSKNLQEMLSRQRKERGLLTVPSLEQFNNSKSEETAFNDIYATVTKKQSEINFLQREVSDLKEELQGSRLANYARMEAMEQQQSEYINTIIEMKMKCAESEMKASESTFRYSQLKRTMSSKLTL